MIKIGSVFIMIIVLAQNSVPTYRNILIIPKITSHIFLVIDIVRLRRFTSSKEMS